MRSEQQQAFEKNLKGGKIKEIISKFEADLPVPLHIEESQDWRMGQSDLANRRLQFKVENLGSGHQGERDDAIGGEFGDCKPSSNESQV